MSKISKTVKINLDKPRTLLLDMNAMIAFDNETGLNYLEFSRNLKDASAKELRALLWCMLIHEDKTLTIENVGAMVTKDNFEDVFIALLTAQMINMPEIEPGDKRDPEAPSPLV